MKKWVEVFSAIFDEDNYTPITANSEDEYRKVTSIYPFRDEQLEQVLIKSIKLLGIYMHSQYTLIWNFGTVVRFSCKIKMLLATKENLGSLTFRFMIQNCWFICVCVCLCPFLWVNGVDILPGIFFYTIRLNCSDTKSIWYWWSWLWRKFLQNNALANVCLDLAFEPLHFNTM